MFKASGGGKGPRKCQDAGIRCVTLVYGDGSRRCVDEEGGLSDDADSCIVAYVEGRTLRHAENGFCLDNKSDNDPESFLWYNCHGGRNQDYEERSGRWCSVGHTGGDEQCLEASP